MRLKYVSPVNYENTLSFINNHVFKPISLQTSESIVLAGTTPKNLFFKPIISGSVKVSNRHPDGTRYYYNSPYVVYKETIDYIIDYTNGTIVRTPESSIPDVSAKPVPTPANYQVASNSEYLVWVTYCHSSFRKTLPKNSSLTRLTNKIKNNDTLNIITLGDSITNLNEPEQSKHEYWNQFVSQLKSDWPNMKTVNVNNKAISGSGSVDLADTTKLSTRVTENPDLIIIAYGMNDQDNSAAIEESNFRTGIAWINTNFPNADIILVSGCLGNYDSFYNSTQQTNFLAFQEVMRKIAGDTPNVGFADVTANWQAFTTRKSSHDLWRNDVNHPTSFGHMEIYAPVLETFIPA